MNRDSWRCPLIDSRLQKHAEAVAKKTGVLLGGATEVFDLAGRHQFILLLENGLLPESKVLDIGCGSLRAGYWLIRFLDPGCYFGIEPSPKRLSAGIEYFITPEIKETKQPAFAHNDDFEFSVFEQKFDFFLANSIWTHASGRQIERMLDSFVDNTNDNAAFLTSYFRVSVPDEEYQGDQWSTNVIRHKRIWLRDLCRARSLSFHEITHQGPLGHLMWVRTGQEWLLIKRPQGTK